jgi:nucleotide-binding universal stress UspA family protein
MTPADRDELLAAMKRLAQDHAASTSVRIELELCEGNAAKEILARTSSLPSDLLVMGTHGRSGFERLVLGSVTERVLRKAACPVLSVPGHARGVVPRAPVDYKRILCATDFSDCSINALNYAMSLAQEADARLTVMHVIELPPELPPHVHHTVHDGAWTLGEYVEAASLYRRDRLKALIPEAVAAYCTVETVMVSGTPYREILRVAEERLIDVIVMGIHGRGAVDMLFFGSTTQHVVRQAACPVLTLRKG